MNIYFAGSIRGGREDKELYLQIVKLLEKYGKVLTEHVGYKALTPMGETELTVEFIYNRDMEWMSKSDVLVAEVTTPSLGVGYELAKAEGPKKILCLFREQEGKSLSAMIAGNKNVRVEKYQDLSDIEKILKVFFKNKL